MPSKKHILHLEEDEAFSNMVNLQLNKVAKAKMGDELVFDIIKSPFEGIEAISNNEYDCILCDYKLDKGTGVDFLKAARSMGVNTPIVFLAGLDNAELAKEAIESGANDYLSKDLVVSSYERAYNTLDSHIQHHAISNDIRSMEQELNVSRNRYQMVFENSNDAILFLDETGIFDCNHVTESLTGYCREDLIGNSPSMLLSGTQNDWNYSKGSIFNAYRPIIGNKKSLDWTIERKDGSKVQCNAVINRFEAYGRVEVMITLHDVSGLKAIVERARNSEERSRILLNSPFIDAIFLTDREGTILDANESAASIMNSSHENTIGRKLSEVIDPRMQPIFIQLYKELNSSKTEIKTQMRQGDKTYSVIISPMLGKDGEIERVALFAKDITEYKSTNDKLKSAMKCSNDIVHALPIGLYIFKFEPPGTLMLIDANPTAQNNSHLDMDYAIGSEYSSVWKSAQSAELKKHLIEVALGGPSYIDDNYVFIYDEKKFNYNLRAFKLPGDRICLAEYDITRLMDVEAELEKNRANLEKLVSITKDINVLNIRVVLERIANYIWDIVPYDAVSFYQTNFEKEMMMPLFASGMEKEKVMEYFPSIYEGATGRVARKGKPEIINDPYNDADIVIVPGTEKKDERMMSIPLIGHGGTIGVLNLFRIGKDFGERELELSNMFVAHSAVALENAILFDNLKRSKDLTEFFMSMLAHDLKNPLAVSYGYTELLKELPHTRQISKKLCYQNDRMKHVIDNAILFVRLEEGEISKKYVCNDLKAIITDAVQYFRYHPKYENIEVKHLNDCCQINCLPVLVNVFTNLIDNALKYANSCHLKYYKENGSYIIEFLDEGCEDFCEADISNLFKRFTRMENGSNVKGYGLGLSIVKRIVDLHHGKITVEANHGIGTKFIVELPIEPK